MYGLKLLREDCSTSRRSAGETPVVTYHAKRKVGRKTQRLASSSSNNKIDQTKLWLIGLSRCVYCGVLRRCFAAPEVASVGGLPQAVAWSISCHLESFNTRYLSKRFYS
jgi:hypothetical protein